MFANLLASTGNQPMSCTQPVLAESYLCPATHLKAIRFKGADFVPNLELNCNKCPSCKLRKAKEWALRCWHESQMHEHNSYITLTYDDKHLPLYHDLDHRDFQLFMKRLRIKYPEKNYSFYMCGEYGDVTHRPHYHVVLFGYWPPDAIYHRTQNKNRYFKSQELDKFWRCGFTDTSSVNYYSAGYVARYTLKKQLPKNDLQDRYIYTDFNGETKVRKFEYVRMSTNPAIGLSWIKKYAEQTIRNNYILDPKGNPFPIPRYYNEYLASEVCSETAEKNADQRIETARASPDNTPERLAAKAICTLAKLKQLPRPYL